MNMTGGLRHLDTKYFKETRKRLETGIGQYNEMKKDLGHTTEKLLLNWRGKGKTEFEKEYRILMQQLTDIADLMYELRDNLIDSEANYIEVDLAIAKQLTME